VLVLDETAFTRGKKGVSIKEKRGGGEWGKTLRSCWLGGDPISSRSLRTGEKGGEKGGQTSEWSRNAGTGFPR